MKRLKAVLVDLVVLGTAVGLLAWFNPLLFPKIAVLLIFTVVTFITVMLHRRNGEAFLTDPIMRFGLEFIISLLIAIVVDQPLMWPFVAVVTLFFVVPLGIIFIVRGNNRECWKSAITLLSCNPLVFFLGVLKGKDD